MATGECRISDMDRHTVAGTSAFTVSLKTTSCNSSQDGTKELGLSTCQLTQESLGDEYLENNCVDDPVKLCDFQLLENRIMKTVDSVYQVGNHGYSGFISLLKAKLRWSVFRCASTTPH